MRLRNMLKICLVFFKSEPQYAYKRYAYKKNIYLVHCNAHSLNIFVLIYWGKTYSAEIKKG